MKLKQAKQIINTKDETIASLINQLKSCNNNNARFPQQQQQPQYDQQKQGKKETIKIINDQQLIQLLNTRQLTPTNKSPQITTVKQIKNIQTAPNQQQQQQQKIQILNAPSVNNQQIVSVLPATIIQGNSATAVVQSPTPIVIASSNHQSPHSSISSQSASFNNPKIVSIQPLNKVISIAPQSNSVTLDTSGSAAKRIKIENGTSSVNRNNIKPLAPKVNTQNAPQIVKPNPILINKPPTAAIEMLIPTVNKQQQQQQQILTSPSIATILYSTTESQNEAEQTTLFFGSEDTNSNNDMNNGDSNQYLSSLSKKQFRMMKNRESACLSRKRKKEVSSIKYFQ